MNDSPIIIIGMGSSGTRLLVEIIERCGVFMGGTLSQNEFKEPSIFFAGANAFVDEFRYVDPLRPDWKDVVEAKAQKIDLFVKTVLPQAYSATGYRGGAWGFKDPRNTFVLPLYVRAFPRCRVLHVIRDGRDVAMTKVSEQWPKLKDTDRLDRWFRVWENNVEVGASYRGQLPAGQFFEVRYEDVCVGLQSAVEALSNLLGVPAAEVAKVVKASAHRRRLNKWLERPEDFEFARGSQVLCKYGYIEEIGGVTPLGGDSV